MSTSTLLSLVEAGFRPDEFPQSRQGGQAMTVHDGQKVSKSLQAAVQCQSYSSKNQTLACLFCCDAPYSFGHAQAQLPKSVCL